MANEETTQKIGAGHASAMYRQGLAELRGAMYPESNIAQPTAYGIAGTRTPGEVMEERQGEARDPDEKPSILDERLERAEHTPEPLESPQQERE